MTRPITARPMPPPAFPEPERNLERVRRDIIAAAGIADAAYDESRVAPVLSAYRDYIVGSPMSFRTTTKPKGVRELNVRYVELEKPHDAYRIARENGLIPV